MNVHTVKQNLLTTIAGKEDFLKEQIEFANSPYAGEILKAAINATVDMLELNITELKKILVDVEICCEKDIEKSWQLNPERMGR